MDKIGRLRALEKAVELVAKATPGPWRVDDTRDDIEVVGRPARKCKRYGKAGEWAVAKVEDQDFDFDTTGLNSANAIAIASAVNFIREHGSALIAELGQEVGEEQAPVAWIDAHEKIDYSGYDSTPAWIVLDKKGRHASAAYPFKHAAVNDAILGGMSNPEYEDLEDNSARWHILRKRGYRAVRCRVLIRE